MFFHAKVGSNAATTSIDNSRNQEAAKIINFMIQPQNKEADASSKALKQGFRKLGFRFNTHLNEGHHSDTGEDSVSREPSSEEDSEESVSASDEMTTSEQNALFLKKNLQLDHSSHGNDSKYLIVRFSLYLRLYQTFQNKKVLSNFAFSRVRMSP